MMLFFDTPTEPCPVCSEVIPDTQFAECLKCGKAFHMRMTEDAEVRKDCGTVYIDAERWSMNFVCDICFEAGENASTAMFHNTI